MSRDTTEISRTYRAKGQSNDFDIEAFHELKNVHFRKNGSLCLECKSDDIPMLILALENVKNYLDNT